MALESVLLGTSPTGEGGDNLRAAMTKLNTNIALLAGFHIAATDPTVNDDSADGHWVGQKWLNTTDNSIHLAISVASGAAVWVDITTAATITGLTNPLVATFDADGELIKDAVFSGFTDRYYDLASDPSSLVSAGVATLVATHNAYRYGALSSALEVTLPDPSTVTSGDAPFGVIAVQLASGGSLSIGATHAWAWEKTNPGDPDPVIASSEGAHIRLRYQYDPVAGRYAVFVAYLVYSGPATAPTEVTYVSGSMSVGTSSANSNVNSTSHTHNFTSTTQDGYLALLVLILTDASTGNTISATNLSVAATEIAVSPTTSGNAIWSGIIIPTQTQVDNGIPMTFSYANEAAQIVCLEVYGVDPTAPIVDPQTANPTATTVGPLTVTTTRADSLLVAAVQCDENVTASTTTANGFTELYVGAPGAARGGHVVSIRTAPTAGAYSSPVYGGSASDRINAQAFAVQPAA